jgi:hypothetical protein
MGKRGLKKRAESLSLQILRHENKIKHERAKQLPDEGKIHHYGRLRLRRLKIIFREY